MKTFKELLTENTSNTVSTEIQNELMKLIIDSTEAAKERRTKYMTKYIDDCIEFYNNGRWEELEKAGFESQTRSIGYNTPAFDAFKKIEAQAGYTSDDYTFVWNAYRKGGNTVEGAAKKVVEDEFNDKRKKVLTTILKKFKSEDKVKSMKATNHTNGFDITIILEEGRLEVTNIMAGGFNVQKLHYRTLVKRH